ncbi:uncharacterized protein LOC110815139 [Carica papaya]|uniref:uncharacterized protein LOC110815139 n=1 Tax=Carica papaya TaxID=3649 RepID=UPI000B8CE2B3|nr:uncharacterized protein LOC110815139 [Carica papaya]
MARGEWGYGGGRGSGCSYKRTTLIVCSVNIIIALYVLRSLYASLYIYSSSNNVVNYTPDQIRKMEESIRVRRAKEPAELVKLVKKLRHELSSEEPVIEISRVVKQRLTDELLERLRSLDDSVNATQRRGGCTFNLNLSILSLSYKNLKIVLNALSMVSKAVKAGRVSQMKRLLQMN